MDAAQIARTANYASHLPPHRLTVPIAFMEAELGIGFVPEEYVGITTEWKQKLAMLDAHKSQLMTVGYDPDFRLPHPATYVS